MSFNNFNLIPDEMKSYLQWIVWRYEEGDGGKPVKIPYDAKSGKYASVTDPSTWTSFPQAVANSTFYSGIGFVLTDNDPYSFIDLDNTYGDQVALERQLKIYSEFTSYAERSPSGNGLHIIVKGKVPQGRKRSFIEVYSSLRYMTMTGEVYRDLPIEPHHDLLNALWQQMGGGVAADFYDGNVPQKEPDDQVIARALSADNGPKFDQLLRGEWTSLYPSQSEADLAFVDIVAFYTQNRAQIERIFRASALGKRPKAQRQDYVTWMVNKSFDRMLPPVDVQALGEQLRLQLGADKQTEPTLPANQPNALIVYQEPVIPGLEDQEQGNKHLDNPPVGLVGEIAQFVYESSPRPLKEVALCAAIGLMAGICGRAYNVSGTGLNFYTLLLAQTGTGKEAISSGVSKLIGAVASQVPNARDFIGPGSIRSDAGLIKWLINKPSIVSTINEFGLQMCQMSSHIANKNDVAIKQALLSLYNKSGATDYLDPFAYSDQQKNTVVVHSPSFSLLGESVPEEFYKWLDEATIGGGLLPRFMIIEVPPGIRPKLNERHKDVQPSMTLIDRLAKLISFSLTLNTHTPRKVQDVSLTPEAAKLLKDFNEFCDAQMEHAGSQNVIRQLWNRAHMKTQKLAALLAVGCDIYAPIITAEQIEWAKSLVTRDVLNMLGRFVRGEIGQETAENKQVLDVRHAIIEYLKATEDKLKPYDVPMALHAKGLVPYAYLQRKLVCQASFRRDRIGGTAAIKRVLQVMIDSGILEEIPTRQLMADYKLKMRTYAIADFKALKNLN